MALRVTSPLVGSRFDQDDDASVGSPHGPMERLHVLRLIDFASRFRRLPGFVFAEAPAAMQTCGFVL